MKTCTRDRRQADTEIAIVAHGLMCAYGCATNDYDIYGTYCRVLGPMFFFMQKKQQKNVFLIFPWLFLFLLFFCLFGVQKEARYLAPITMFHGRINSD